ncbi:hypothetical protein NC652_037405 [Populus alba x Populus x berolinensis]|nr:hypothetical protein NC652_037405 [Populus alba x Populus x berolinensis]
MAVVMKQLDGADEAIELIKSFRHLYPYDSRESIENVLVELYKVDGVNNSLTCEDGHRKIVMVLAATNFSWDIDEALRLVRCLLSSSCFGVSFHSLILPSGGVVTKVTTDADIDEVARRTEGYSEDALTNVCRDASLNGMR